MQSPRTDCMAIACVAVSLLASAVTLGDSSQIDASDLRTFLLEGYRQAFSVVDHVKFTYAVQQWTSPECRQGRRCQPSGNTTRQMAGRGWKRAAKPHRGKMERSGIPCMTANSLSIGTRPKGQGTQGQNAAGPLGRSRTMGCSNRTWDLFGSSGISTESYRVTSCQARASYWRLRRPALAD